MAIFNQFKTPQIPRRQIDPAQLAQFLAAPEIAKQQVRGQLFQNLSQLPQSIFNTVGQIGQYQQQQQMNPLELAIKKAQIQEITSKAAQEQAKANALANPMSKSTDLTPEAVDMLAQRTLTGLQDPMGLGTKIRVPVFNRMSEIQHQNGDTIGEAASRQASFRASQQELSRLQSQRGLIMSFANTADKNLDLATQLSDQVDRTGLPVINRWIVAGKQQVAGDPQTAAFNAAIRTAINEAAKVTSGASGGTVTSDTARKEIEDTLNATQNPEQIKMVIQTLKTDMANRRSGYDEQIQSALDNIKNLSSKSNKPALVSNPKITQNPKSLGTGPMIRIQDSSGQLHDIPASNIGKAKQIDPGLKILGAH